MTAAPLDRPQAVRPSDFDALRVPREAPVPSSAVDRATLAVDLDQWWHRLTLGQRLALQLEHDA